MGGDTPPALLNKPDYPEEHVEYLFAFNLLSRSRRVGMNAWSIPLSEIEVYCRLFDVIDKELFLIVIIELDIIYLNHIRKDE